VATALEDELHEPRDGGLVFDQEDSCHAESVGISSRRDDGYRGRDPG
jgi:hypothetical protein